jgi:Tol biopolymer transport system component
MGGSTIGEARVTWSLRDADAGTIDSSGQFTAGDVVGNFVGVIEAQATDSGFTASASVAVVPGPLVKIFIAPDPVALGAGMKQQFVAVGADRFGNRIQGLNFIWSMLLESGKIEEGSGVFTAGNEPGQYLNAITASTTYRGVRHSGDASVTIESGRIAFISDRDSDSLDLYLMKSDGSNVRRLTNSGIDLSRVSWSPDGRYIVYSSGGNIYVVSDDGKWSAEILDQPLDAFDPAWSPDGLTIAYQQFTGPLEQDAEIYSMDVNGGNRRRLTTNNYYDAYPSWSPDGSQLVIIGGRRSNPLAGGLYIIDVSDKKRGKIQLADFNLFPSWSPVDNRIVYQSGDLQSSIAVFWVIKMMNADGTGGQDLVAGNSPTWSPDGQLIAFSSSVEAISVDPDDKTPNAAEIYVCQLFACEIGVTATTNRLTDNKAFDGLPSWAPPKSGVRVDESSIVVPRSRSLKATYTFVEIAARAKAAVVRIETKSGTGSGIIIAPDGLIITNHHVVGNTNDVTVCFDDLNCEAGIVLERDLFRDLASIKVESEDLHWLELGDDSRLAIGDELIAAGFPLGSNRLTVTKGSATAIRIYPGRNLRLIQTDAAINPGNSGGPLLNLQGQVVGVVSSKIIGAGVTGLGFAISVNTLRMFLHSTSQFPTLPVVPMVVPTPRPPPTPTPVPLTKQEVESRGLIRDLALMDLHGIDLSGVSLPRVD